MSREGWGSCSDHGLLWRRATEALLAEAETVENVCLTSGLTVVARVSEVTQDGSTALLRGPDDPRPVRAVAVVVVGPLVAVDQVDPRHQMRRQGGVIQVDPGIDHRQHDPLPPGRSATSPARTRSSP